jgi:hypothetical protein
MSNLPIICSQNLARLYEEISQHPPFKKYSIYLISDFIELLVNSALSQETRKVLIPGIFSLMDISTDFEYQQLHTLLNTTSKAIFKGLYAQYQKDHKFKGKI